jgi:hypothetical protein
MSSIDTPRTIDFVWSSAREAQQAATDAAAARLKLEALAADLADLGYRYRLLEAPPTERTLLRVWSPLRQEGGETVVCLRAGDDGWVFAAFPFGPVLCTAEEIEKPGDALEAAQAIAARVAELP